MAGIARSVRLHGHPVTVPAVLLSGGETTVTIGVGAVPGRGRRNTEFLLALALRGEAGIFAISADTDGIDGTQDAAGAIVTPDTLRRAAAPGLGPAASLAGHDSYSLFEGLGDLVVTGPTRTNVNDFRAVLVLPSASRHPTHPVFRRRTNVRRSINGRHARSVVPGRHPRGSSS